MKRYTLWLLLLFGLAACTPVQTQSAEPQAADEPTPTEATTGSTQTEPVPYHFEPYDLDTRQQVGLETTVPGNFRQIINIDEAVWLRLHFSDYNLGRNSYLTITSRQDGGDQRLDNRTLSQWEDSSAVFNGNAVEIELHVDPSDENVYFVIDAVKSRKGSVLEECCRCHSLFVAYRGTGACRCHYVRGLSRGRGWKCSC